MPRLRRSLLASAAALVLAAPAAAAAPAGETIVSALAGPPKASFLERVRTGEIGGVILVGRWSPAEFSRTTATLHAAGCAIGRPLLVFVDQEGGFARRLTWAAPWSSEGQLGRLSSVAQVRSEAGSAAVSLREAGVDVDLAPVADTLRPHGFLGDRSYGGDTSLVGRLAATFVQALQAGGVAATAKHFPGLGAARRSTDDSIVTVRTTPLAPFSQAIAAGAKLVMVSNAIYPRLDPRGVPAVFSRTIVTGLLRGKLGFRGVVVTDALDAPAGVETRDAPGRALAAGVDLFLYTSGSAAHYGYEQLAADVERSATVRAQLARAIARIHTLQRWLGRTC